MFNLVLLIIFPALMAFAASSDLLTMRISNRIVLALIAGFLAMALIMGMPLQQFGAHLLTGLIVLAVAFALFSFGWVGGGDAKLAAATALWLGTPVTYTYLIYAALAGGVLTLVILGLRMLPMSPFLSRFEWIERLHSKVTKIPYGIALAAGGLLVYPQSAMFTHFAG